MSNLSNQARQYKNSAETRAKNAAALLIKQTAFDFLNCNTEEPTFQILTIPYVSAKFHWDALFYPFYHVAKLLCDIVRCIAFTGLWLQTQLSNDENAQKISSEALKLQFLNVGLDILNVVFSSISLISRTIATMAHGGYAPDYVAREATQIAREKGYGFISPAVGSVFGWATNIGMNVVEKEISDRTFKF